MKAILVMEMPEDCNRCYLSNYVESCREFYCGAADKSLMWRVNDLPRGFKPDWCPLRPLPDYKPEPDIGGWTNGEPITEELTDWLMDFGFNCCLEAITGGNHDETEDD